MPRAILPLLLLVLLGAADAAWARTLSATITRVATPVATLEGVHVRLDWPEGATQGELQLRAARVDAPDLGYRFRDVDWRCPLRRDGQGGWRCDGQVRQQRGAPLRLALALAPGMAKVDAALSAGGQGQARLAVQYERAAPDLTRIDLVAVPVAWAQALASQAWLAGRLHGGTLDGTVRVHAPRGGPLHVEAPLTLGGVAFDTADGSIAGEGLDARLRIDWRALAGGPHVTVDGALRGGELLFGNAYVALPAHPVAVRVALQGGAEGWTVPTFSASDPGVLEASGRAALAGDGSVRSLDLALHSAAVAVLPERYLSGWLGIAGLTGLTLEGALSVELALRDGALHALALRSVALDVAAPDGRFAFNGLDGELRIVAGGSADSTLGWRDGALGDIAFGPARLPWRSRDGRLALREPVRVALLGGEVALSGVSLALPRDGKGMEMEGAVAVEALDMASLATALGLPAFPGTLSGVIPRMRYAGERLAFDGGLSMRAFDGEVRVSSLAMERPFGVAPTLSADIVLEGLDMQALTGVFDFGSISGRLHGEVLGLRLVDWQATAFDAELHTEKTRGVRQRISQRAVQNISSVGDASFVTSLQGRLLAVFDDFGYRRIGISCRLANGVCAMAGLHPRGAGFAIVEGAGLPRLDIVGYNRNVDWETLVERLAAVGSGDVTPVFD
ncbi:hypothetical protein [Luteimonas sp. MC1825]|uniref:hypothetical protein n=1 Tax=Luteimonas sp. MC1825 TaxID=2761107 RepID=UPI00160D1D95|nr:hypothetical protein [Luteimonas sp. MC1825]MBB6599727.1 hypothetical protein [Luteimonas sp. MC1825]QOC87408.1 hypothetical protein IDM46_09010 [Luteimonas sp. MC1825]